ncbi:MAG: pilus assembly protein PilM [Bdellovibrionales bacterium]|jgi:general secretion pathway protein L|nr:pilus assembly protein PilM [Bdellovibrionales bacterium]MBT3526711.1 pilus assembly protein PilM [Bdellovibrionales bacterium]MBT7670651.1 pilus assembly protein PilM [Bdellovibrionales bacterium]MBT7767902.1 pilus assembly protein PilM [Bdellovibrionales bacterium]
MSILTIDIGTYSIKFYRTSGVKRNLVVEDMAEVVISDLLDHDQSEFSIFETQLEVIQDYLKQSNYTGRLVFQVPNKMVTYRFLDIPINNRKKAELMIPFQLDDDLPYPVASTHYVFDLEKSSKHFYAFANITQQDNFDDLFNTLNQKELLPKLLSSEAFYFSHFIKSAGIKASFAIMDMGHATTKLYYFNRGRLISCHLSYIAGSTITDVIAKTYQVEEQEAVEYKHNKSFFLDPDQYESATPEQVEFAQLMKAIVDPLLKDINRWNLGFRVTTGIPIKKLLLTGGTSSISNIQNYISKNINIQVEPLATHDYVTGPQKKSISKNQQHSFALTQAMALTSHDRTPPPTFLTGNYSPNFSEGIPIHSATFLGIRIWAVVLLVVMAFTFEHYLLTRQQSALNRVLAKEIKNVHLKIPPKTRMLYRKKPKRILSMVRRKQQQQRAAIKSMQKANSSSALLPLSRLSQTVASNRAVVLKRYSMQGNNILATFTSEHLRDLKSLQRQLKAANFINSSITMNNKDHQLDLRYQVEVQ